VRLTIDPGDADLPQSLVRADDAVDEYGIIRAGEDLQEAESVVIRGPVGAVVDRGGGPGRRYFDTRTTS
jgi:hypothetical protein